MNSEFLLFFLLAHFIGDFVFQTNKIAKMKSEEIKGVFYHSMIVLISQVALLAIFGWKGILAGLISSIIHFAIDYSKLSIGKYLNRFSFLYFIFDQILHIAVIITIAYYFKPTVALNANVFLCIKYMNFIIIFTYITTVMSKMLLRDLFENARNSPFFLGKERLIDGITSLMIFFSMVSFNLLIATFISIVLCIIYIIIQKKLYPYSFNNIVIKFSFYLLAGYIGKCIFIYL